MHNNPANVHKAAALAKAWDTVFRLRQHASHFARDLCGGGQLHVARLRYAQSGAIGGVGVRDIVHLLL